MTHTNPRPTIGEPMSELFDADIPRVDLVGAAANGTAFLFAKAADNPSMFGPEEVRALIKEQENTPMETPTVDPVTKADEVDITVPLAEPDEKPPGGAGENDPGSPAWEAVDHATAEKWLGILYRAQNALGVLANREDTELVTGNGHGDGMAAYNLDEAAQAIGYAISVLAVYSANEKAEVELDLELEAIGKTIALAGDLADLEVLERLAPIVKAGRVLSAANEAALRGAAESINKVLASLPEPATVEKETNVEQPNTPAATAAPETDVTKAEALRIVYDADGSVVGVVKPSAVMPVEGGGKPEASEPEDEAAAEPTVEDLEPAPDAEVGVPADELAKASPVEDEPVEKGAEPEAIAKAVADLRKELLEKDAAHTAVVEDLEAKIAKLSAEPAPSKVLSNGVLPPEHQMRGQNDGARAADAGRAEELRKQLSEAATPAEQEVIKSELNELAIAALKGVRTGQQ